MCLLNPMACMIAEPVRTLPSPQLYEAMTRSHEACVWVLLSPLIYFVAAMVDWVESKRSSCGS